MKMMLPSKTLIQNQIPKTRKTPITPHRIMPLNRWEHREMIPLAHQLVRILLRYLPDRERQFSGQFL